MERGAGRLNEREGEPAMCIHFMYSYSRPDKRALKSTTKNVGNILKLREHNWNFLEENFKIRSRTGYRFQIENLTGKIHRSTNFIGEQTKHIG